MDFKPGDVVTIKTLVGADRPPQLIVLERIDQTCPGGTQTWYSCRTTQCSVRYQLGLGKPLKDWSFDNELTKFLSVELAPLPETPETPEPPGEDVVAGLRLDTNKLRSGLNHLRSELNNLRTRVAQLCRGDAGEAAKP